MYGYHVRTVEERLADPSWTRPKSWLLLVPLLSLGTLSFVWFWMRANLDPEEKGRYELWAWVWGFVALGGGTLGGGGLFFGTADEIAVSAVIWILRVTSVVHAWAMNQRRLERMARREVGVEVAMIAAAQARGARAGGPAQRFPTSHLATASVPEGYDPRLAASFPQVYAGAEDLGVPPRPEPPVAAPRPAPPVDPAAHGRVLEPPPYPGAAAPVGSLPPERVPDVEPEPQRWMPVAPPRPGDPHAPRRGPGRRLDL